MDCTKRKSGHWHVCLCIKVTVFDLRVPVSHPCRSMPSYVSFLSLFSYSSCFTHGCLDGTGPRVGFDVHTHLGRRSFGLSVFARPSSGLEQSVNPIPVPVLLSASPAKPARCNSSPGKHLGLSMRSYSSLFALGSKAEKA
ncbi:hypothetical protein PMIN07_000062 [Paraphaeosphaeria minitans]